MKIIHVTAEASNLHSQPDTSAVNSLKEISLKYKIIINKDHKPQENHRAQEKWIVSISKPKESSELNKISKNIIKKQQINVNTYGQEAPKEESGKPTKDDHDKNESGFPQEVINTSTRFFKVSPPEPSLKEDNKNIKRLQPPFSYFKDIYPRPTLKIK
ncbi:hypothetical protein O181_051398 [Austropuccinia psidii MF-1]|uniref:Uncharacterized protein n=1 Tax=Austropuccinia psidii MF-1 TaxID=1389203 RepID=A0A9Q3E0V9_9BASI|nr:hypothetical protein [Austropuccinia psidii MF-1]